MGNKNDIKKSIEAAKKEFKEEPMDANYAHPIVGIISRGRVKRIIKELGNLKGRTILDAGCEAGYVSLQIAEQCKPKKIYAIDIVEDALHKFTIKIPSKYYSKITVDKGLIQKLPYKNNIFDAIVATEVLEHAPQLSRIISEFKRVLKKDGKLIITIPNEKLRRITYPIARLLGINTSIEKEVTLFEYTPLDILKELQQQRLVSNFKDTKVFAFPYKIFPLTYFIITKKNEKEDTVD